MAYRNNRPLITHVERARCPQCNEELRAVEEDVYRVIHEKMYFGDGEIAWCDSMMCHHAGFGHTQDVVSIFAVESESAYEDWSGTHASDVESVVETARRIGSLYENGQVVVWIHGRRRGSTLESL